MKDRALAIGTLVSIKRTGVLIDQQPQLALTYDVDAPGGRQFRGVAREIVGLDEFHVMTPGLVLPVSYDSTKSDDNLKVAQDGDRNVVNAMLPQRQIQSGLLSPMQVQIAERGLQLSVSSPASTQPVKSGRADRLSNSMCVSPGRTVPCSHPEAARREPDPPNPASHGRQRYVPAWLRRRYSHRLPGEPVAAPSTKTSRGGYLLPSSVQVGNLLANP